MNWRVKALIQNTVSILPGALSLNIYYYIQKKFGGLKNFKYDDALKAGVIIWKKILEQGGSPKGKVFFELGTGRAPMLPLSLWLMGADKVITVDLNNYLKPEIFYSCITSFLNQYERTHDLFDGYIIKERLDVLREIRNNEFDMASIGIIYKPNQDAADVDLPAQSIDYYISYNVLEHIPEQTIKNIFNEGTRLLCNDGFFVHKIDYSDHFSHSDKSISAINFLQYSDFSWSFYASKKFMFMNRLRHDDFLEIFSECSQDVLSVEIEEDKNIDLILSDNDISLAKRFIGKEKKIICITGAWMVTKCDENLS